jgi:hypothetical protein
MRRVGGDYIVPFRTVDEIELAAPKARRFSAQAND